MPDRIAKLNRKPRLRVAGLMSGTSVDGVDAAIVDITGHEVVLRGHHTFAYPASIRQLVLGLADPETARIDDLCHANAALGELFASAVVKLAERSGIALRSIDLIGSHGQTVYHIPEGRTFRGRRLRSTLQIGEPSVIAERTGITTVADFRPRDVAAGGQGAPLAPYVDHFLFRHRRRSRAVQNIGGIANVTYLAPGCRRESVLGFDTGPGNMLMDRAVSLATSGAKHYDIDGRMAARGCVDVDLLGELMHHPFLRRKPPKSTGREEFGMAFCDQVYRRASDRHMSPDDILATFTAFTVEAIADAYKRHLPDPIDEVILCGGGARNPVLVRMIEARLQPARVMTTDALGIDADAKEAVSFAILARETIRGTANNLPSATGARRSVVLGKIVPPC